VDRGVGSLDDPNSVNVAGTVAAEAEEAVAQVVVRGEAAQHEIAAELTQRLKAYKRHTMNSILTVRLTEEEQRILARRSRRAGMKKATFVRQLIRESPLETAADVLRDLAAHQGDARLRVTPR